MRADASSVARAGAPQRNRQREPENAAAVNAKIS